MSDLEGKYAKFLEESLKIQRICSVDALLGWDMETQMPEKGASARADVSGQIAALVHDMATGAAYTDALEAVLAEVDALDVDRATIVRDAKEELEKTRKFDPSFVKELATLTSNAHGVWAAAKDSNDLASFLPCLTRIVAMKRQEAAIIGFAASPYDALLDEYDPGLTTASVERTLGELSSFLAPFVDRILASPHTVDARLARFALPVDRQRDVNVALSRELGFDLLGGCFGEAPHPFMTRIHPGDVRIATRYVQDDALNAVFSTLHETGHAFYEQGLPEAHYGTSGGEAASFGLHESQSRLWENLIGRSLPFWKWCAPFLKRHQAFPADLSAEDVWRSLNAVARTPIRTDADEVTYNLHICPRFEIERALIEGTLEVADVRDAWHDGMKKHLGIVPKNDTEGVLQDSHWAAGYFGYFPSYAIGNIYAAQLGEAMRRTLPGLDTMLAQGLFTLPLGWLRGAVHRHGGTLEADEIVRRATGSGLSAQPFMRYIESKYTAIYKL